MVKTSTAIGQLAGVCMTKSMVIKPFVNWCTCRCKGVHVHVYVDINWKKVIKYQTQYCSLHAVATSQKSGE